MKRKDEVEGKGKDEEVKRNMRRALQSVLFIMMYSLWLLVVLRKGNE